ncbi:unnamed protein product [Dracunculus medinensis]|uniref:ARID domain-containing protein n=1 Tax=Dracunculus medinensis TaxID=318479 RepID=A0A3P7PLV8_DRAME|nr:unnamed protein product [Dracunculus medinensis]
MLISEENMERRKRRSPVEEYIDSLMDSPEKLQRCTNFYQNLRSFYRRKWNCPFKAPYIQGVEVNLFRLYDTVTSFGGWQKVSMNEKWRDIAQALGVAEGVAVAEHAVKVLYMRYLSKYEQIELIGEVDDTDSDIITSRGRSKGCSSFATADCPISLLHRQISDYPRPWFERKVDSDYDGLVKGLLCGLPNEVDFAVNICTLLSHPGPRVLRLSAAPQLMTLLVAHVGIFPDDDGAIYHLYEGWRGASHRDFIAFWRGAGITDVEVLSLIPHVTVSKFPEDELDMFTGLEMEFEPRNVVSWRIQQILSIMRNLSFEIINKSVMASNWPLLKFLFICSNCKWSALRAAALDTLSNIACEIDLTSEEFSMTNHLLLKTVSQCLHSSDKFMVIRALEVLAGLCNNECNESLLCEFLNTRILGKIFDAICVKDVMICVYTLEALYQISELGATACHQLSHYPHAINMLINLATVEAVSFAPTGLTGMKVVEFHGPSHTATSQNHSTSHVTRPASFVPPSNTVTNQTPPRSVVATHSSQSRALLPTIPTIGDTKVEQLTAKWIRLNCLLEAGNIIPRGELYACYVEDLRNNYNALSGSVQMFTNIIKAIFPSVVVRVAPNTNSMVFENLKLMKSNVQKNAATSGRTNIAHKTSSAIAASHPVMKKMLSENNMSGSAVNGRLTTSPAEQKQDIGISHSNSPTASVSEDIPRPNPLVNSSSQNSTVEVNSAGTSMTVPSSFPVPNKVQLEVCRAAVEARDVISDDDHHEAKIVRIENTGLKSSATTSEPATSNVNSNPKSSVEMVNFITYKNM